MALLFTLPRVSTIDLVGVVAPRARLYFYATQTSTPQPVYTDAALTVAHQQPVAASDGGLFPTIYLNDALGAYKVVCRDENDQELWSVDPYLVATLYPRTASEIAASVVPSNYTYRAGDPRRYGAAANGTTDDTLAIQTALNANQEVFLDGTYRASGLTMTTTGQRLSSISRGSGIVAASNTQPCIRMAGTRQTISGVIFSTGSLVANDTDTDFVAVLINSTGEVPSNRCVIENITVSGIWTYGVAFQAALYSVLRQSNVDGFRKRAVSITNGGTFNRVEGCMLFDSSVGANPVEGIVYVDNSPSNWIVNNHITRGTGVGVKAIAAVPFNNYLYIIGNDLDNIENYAISVDGFWDVHIDGNWIAAGQAEDLGAVVVANAKKIYITNNSVDGTLGDGEGITLDTCDSGVVSGNCVQYSIRNIVLDDCDRILVTNNTSGQMTGLPSTGSVTQYSYFARNQSDTAGCYWLDNTSVSPTVADYGGISRHNIREPGTLNTRSDGDAYFKDKDVYIGNDDADQTTYRSLHFRTRHPDVYGVISGGASDSNVGQIVLDGLGVGTDNCAIRFYTRNGSGIAERMQITPGGVTQPGVDNTHTLGSASFRWSEVFAGNGTINTSDEREKQNIGPIPDSVLDAWADVEFVQFRWREAVEHKGDGARWHFGVVAQRVRAAFEARGLDPFALGILCYDEWEETPERIVTDARGNVVISDPARPAGNRYGIRYEEALVLEAALMRRELRRIQERA